MKNKYSLTGTYFSNKQKEVLANFAPSNLANLAKVLIKPEVKKSAETNKEVIRPEDEKEMLARINGEYDS
jgi:hypothetical protein